ncbi:type II toxin-antitoxin system YafQ family toxin [Candidatus Kaiserbacteria bacterium]|nr:type II toxin-antitoxin system YafQ family toxin [Candidatus Kaiserbacteria bacterium]MCB9812127.1 type II toxin-antitoxin system YafQ family toxin [Candidatus Nomurabacteria bacterium]
MRYTVHYTSRFKRSLKRVRQLPGFKPKRLKEVIKKLSAGEDLPSNFRDHQLTGNLKAFRECHLAPDILLIYQVDDGLLILVLVNISNHAQLFK